MYSFIVSQKPYCTAPKSAWIGFLVVIDQVKVIASLSVKKLRVHDLIIFR